MICVPAHRAFSLDVRPVRLWLSGSSDFPVIGRWFVEDWLVYLFSYAGLLLDLLAVPLLLWRRTRTAAFALLVVFHFLNDRLFSIGIFPWFAIAATTLFFPPDWPRRLFESLRHGRDPGLLQPGPVRWPWVRRRSSGVIPMSWCLSAWLPSPEPSWVMRSEVHSLTGEAGRPCQNPSRRPWLCPARRQAD